MIGLRVIKSFGTQYPAVFQLILSLQLSSKVEKLIHTIGLCRSKMKCTNLKQLQTITHYQ